MSCWFPGTAGRARGRDRPRVSRLREIRAASQPREDALGYSELLGKGRARIFACNSVRIGYPRSVITYYTNATSRTQTSGIPLRYAGYTSPPYLPCQAVRRWACRVTASNPSNPLPSPLSTAPRKNHPTGRATASAPSRCVPLSGTKAGETQNGVAAFALPFLSKLDRD